MQNTISDKLYYRCIAAADSLISGFFFYQGVAEKSVPLACIGFAMVFVMIVTLRSPNPLGKSLKEIFARRSRHGDALSITCAWLSVGMLLLALAAYVIGLA